MSVPAEPARLTPKTEYGIGRIDLISAVVAAQATAATSEDTRARALEQLAG